MPGEQKETSLTVEQVRQWSQQHWASAKTQETESQSVDEALVEQIYRGLHSASLVELELSRYLEHYLWPRVPLSGPSHAHLFSILALINEKVRQHIPVWGELAPFLLWRSFPSPFSLLTMEGPRWTCHRCCAVRGSLPSVVAFGLATKRTHHAGAHPLRHFPSGGFPESRKRSYQPTYPSVGALLPAPVLLIIL